MQSCSPANHTLAQNLYVDTNRLPFPASFSRFLSNGGPHNFLNPCAFILELCCTRKCSQSAFQRSNYYCHCPSAPRPKTQAKIIASAYLLSDTVQNKLMILFHKKFRNDIICLSMRRHTDRCTDRAVHCNA